MQVLHFVDRMVKVCKCYTLLGGWSKGASVTLCRQDQQDSLKGRLGMSDIFPLSGISGLSFDSPFLTHIIFLPGLLALSGL